ncbi:ImmA/IrrE family metallo-endopeptidase [Mycobacterium sp. TY815]|uniref:ImmA/IrrE family metallo-endopeptidase n=1 Tax=Mycobacterium sp. TY815 TaxID=3050581 RepID=UPI0027428141|nr:ImmA/IrrE family metallo-endopeptidase [Mycobacterium sp. TY815]MDP7707416.1 ImmA/IrrE family metallo-endopeptidase [Mycobacterium sp. TY815]
MLAIARELPIPVPWDRNAFIENVAQLRGRPIRLVAADTAAFADGPCGLWVMYDDEDVILHEAGTSDYHIDQIVGHEIGHMLLEHDKGVRGGAGADYAELCSTYLSDLDPSFVKAMLGRTDYGSEQEREAELFASALVMAVAEASERQSMLRRVFFRR